MSWKVSEITTKALKLKLAFEDALYVSYLEADTLVITLADPNLFISTQGIQIKPENRQMRRKLMRQLKNGSKNTQLTIDEAASDTRLSCYILLGLTTFMNAGIQGLLNMFSAL